MGRLPCWLIAATIIGSATGCSHAATRASGEPAPAPSVEWPAPPAQPRARLAAVLPDRAARWTTRPWWRRALDWASGSEAADSDSPLLARPFGVAFAKDRALLVADPDAQRVVRLDSDGEPSALECRNAPWSAPMAVTVDDAGAVYVADAAAGAIVRS